MTKEQFLEKCDEFLELCGKFGLKWLSKDEASSFKDYHRYKEETCYNINGGNVEKVFEMLGVKVEEVFKLSGNGACIRDIYKLNSELTLQCFSENDDMWIKSHFYSLTDILKGEMKIIKPTLLSDEQMGFLRNFEFDKLSKMDSMIILFNGYGNTTHSIYLPNCIHKFKNLENRMYTDKELGL